MVSVGVWLDGSGSNGLDGSDSDGIDGSEVEGYFCLGV